VGTFGEEVRVYQAKYFCDAIGDVQRRQIRDSWQSCVDSSYFAQLVLWTLCIPHEMSADEVRWWQGWRQRQMTKHRKLIELWSGTNFEAFRSMAKLQRIFDLALRNETGRSLGDALDDLRTSARRVVPLPATEHLQDAIFVKKIEAASVKQHFGARTAFYNFELMRQAVIAGGTADEQTALEDLQTRVFDLWEEQFNLHAPDRLGREFFNTVNAKIASEDGRRLKCDELGAQIVHKRGGLHYWADNCHAGWTDGFEQFGRSEEPPE